MQSIYIPYWDGPDFSFTLLIKEQMQENIQLEPWYFTDSIVFWGAAWLLLSLCE